MKQVLSREDMCEIMNWENVLKNGWVAWDLKSNYAAMTFPRLWCPTTWMIITEK